MIVDYQHLPSLISGVQLNNLVVINNKIYDIFGFCNGKDDTERYKRGFKSTINQLDLNKLDGWKNLGEVGLKPRIGATCFTYQNEIYLWGGMSYTPLSEQEIEVLGNNLPGKKNIYTYADGIKLKIENDRVERQILPNLPNNLLAGGSVVVGNKAYFLGGSIYNKGYNCKDRSSGKLVGKTFYWIDLDNLDDGFHHIDNYPGSPVMFHNMINYQNKYIYVLGGKSNSISSYFRKNGYEFLPVNIIDNWKYDIEKNEWIRISNMPINMVAYTSVLYGDYIINMGGVKYKKTYMIDINKIIDSNKAIPNEIVYPYGGVSDFKSSAIREGAGYPYQDGYFSNLITVYDITNDKFVISDYRLPVNVVIPTVTSIDNKAYFGGGEVQKTIINDRVWKTHAYQVITFNLDQLITKK